MFNAGFISAKSRKNGNFEKSRRDKHRRAAEKCPRVFEAICHKSQPRVFIIHHGETSSNSDLPKFFDRGHSHLLSSVTHLCGLFDHIHLVITSLGAGGTITLRRKEESNRGLNCRNFPASFLQIKLCPNCRRGNFNRCLCFVNVCVDECHRNNTVSLNLYGLTFKLNILIMSEICSGTFLTPSEQYI